MKFNILIIFLITSLLQGYAQAPDERVELVSSICKLADYEEYNMDSARDYVPLFNEFFQRNKEHNAVKMFKRLQSENSIGYDAPVILALSLKKNDNGYIIDESIKIDDERFNGLDLSAIADTISMFYRDSHFSEFYTKMTPFYNKHAINFKDKVISQINFDWYEHFYGKKPEEYFDVLIGFLLGGCNYGPAIEKEGQPRHVYAVMGYVMRPDSLPAYEVQSEIYRDIVIHEFNHSFVNPLIDYKSHFRPLMEPVGNKLLSQCNFVMEMQSYPNWDNVINESIVRAAVACYLLDNGSREDVEKSIMEELKVGFAWMPKLVNKLNFYRKNRSNYPTFESYYPEIISFFDEYTQNTENEISHLFND